MAGCGRTTIRLRQRSQCSPPTPSAAPPRYPLPGSSALSSHTIQAPVPITPGPLPLPVAVPNKSSKPPTPTRRFGGPATGLALQVAYNLIVKGRSISVPVTLSWEEFEQRVNDASRNADNSAVLWNGSNIVASHNYAILIKTISDNGGGDLAIVKVTPHDIHILSHCTDSGRYQERIGIVRGQMRIADGLAFPTKMKTFWVIKYLNIYSTNK